MKKDTGRKLITANKVARHEYFIEDTLEVGIVLTGTEIKSLRQGRASLAESYVRVSGGELQILGMNIKPYEQGNRYNPADPVRPRKLLAHRREILKFQAEVKREGMTIVPLAIYINDKGIAKLEIAIARGKKLYDKRETIAKRDAERKMQQAKRRR